MEIEHRWHINAFPQPSDGFYISSRAVVLHPQTRHCVWQPTLYVPKTRKCKELAPKHLFTPGRVPILNSTYKTQWADTCKSTYTPAFGFPELFLCISAMSLVVSGERAQWRHSDFLCTYNVTEGLSSLCTEWGWHRDVRNAAPWDPGGPGPMLTFPSLSYAYSVGEFWCVKLYELIVYFAEWI